MFKNKRNFMVIGLSLIALILVTRFNHFGSDVYLPDATLAALFLGGLLVKRSSWLGLALIAAFGMDFYAMDAKGVSDYCMSIGYWGLIPTYAVVWGVGRWLAKRQKPFAIMPYALFAWAATSIAFVLSNAFWYGFSDKVATLSIVEFSERVAKYYTPYVGYSLMYLGAAWLIAQGVQSVIANRASQV